MQRKKIGRWLGVLFLCLLLFATLYSRTVAQWNLPKVELAIAQKTESMVQLPRAAIYEDSAGKTYILLVKEQQGAWGKEYICVKQMVVVSQTDGRFVFVQGVGEFRYPVVTGSDQPVGEGSKVRFYELSEWRGRSIDEK